MNSKKKVLLICPKSTTVVSFRRNLIETFINNNYDVAVIVFDSLNNKAIEALGVNLYVIEEENRYEIMESPLRTSSMVRTIKPKAHTTP